MRSTIQCIIYRGEKYYVAECLDFAVVTQGKTLDAAMQNLREAIALHLEDEKLEDLGFVKNPKVEIRVESEEFADVAQTA